MPRNTAEDRGDGRDATNKEGPALLIPMPDESSSPVSAAEKRRAPRVETERPARIRLGTAESELEAGCKIRDISQTGCRIHIRHEDLPADWRLAGESEIHLILPDGQGELLHLSAEGMWVQRSQQGFHILGLRFAESDDAVQHALDAMIQQHLRQSLSATERVTDTTIDRFEPVEIPLQVEGRKPEAHDKSAYRFILDKISQNRLRLRSSPRKGDPRRVLPAGTMLDLAVFPPAWAGVQMRALRMAARVIKSDLHGMDVVYDAGGNDMCRIIHALIPPKIEREGPPKELPVEYIILILAALVLYLIIRSMGP